MPLFEFVAGLLFVLSSGILFNERFRRNKPLVIVTGTVAIIATITLIVALFPALPDRSQQDQTAYDSLAVTPADFTGSTTPAAKDSAEAAACNWARGGTLSECIDAKSARMTRRAATAAALRSRGFAMISRGDYAAAEKDLTAAIDNSDTEDPVTYVARGLTRVYQQKYVDALADCDRFASSLAVMDLLLIVRGATNPHGGSGLVHTCRGLSLSRLGRYPEALQALNQAVDAGIADGSIYRARAVSRRAMGDAAGAQSDEHIATTFATDEYISQLGGADPPNQTP